MEKYGLKCDEWKAKMTFQYIKTQIKEYLTNTLHAVFEENLSRYLMRYGTY